MFMFLVRYQVPAQTVVEFRAACTSAEYGLEVSIDNHKLTVVSTDGNHIKVQHSIDNHTLTLVSSDGNSVKVHMYNSL